MFDPHILLLSMDNNKIDVVPSLSWLEAPPLSHCISYQFRFISSRGIPKVCLIFPKSYIFSTTLCELVEHVTGLSYRLHTREFTTSVKVSYGINTFVFVGERRFIIIINYQSALVWFCTTSPVILVLARIDVITNK
jgi:hypothetical protein